MGRGGRQQPSSPYWQQQQQQQQQFHQTPELTRQLTQDRLAYEQEEEKGYEPLPHLVLTAYSPGFAFSAACGAHLIVFFIFVGLLAGLGSAFFPFSTEVPLYLRGDAAKERLDAVEAGKLQANLAPALATTQLRQSVGTGTKVDRLDEYKLELIFELSDPEGNIFEPENLAFVKALEDEVVRGHPDYTSYCKLQWSQDAIRAQQAATVSGDYAPIDALNDNPPACSIAYSALTPCFPFNITLPDGTVTPGTPCSDVNAFPPGLLNCVDPAGCQASEVELDADFVAAKVAQYAAVEDPNSPANPFVPYFLGFTDARYGAPTGTTTSRALRSEFYFALPLEGYANVEDRLLEQEAKLQSFIYDAYNSALFKASGSGIRVWWQGYGMQTLYTEEVLPQDAAFIFGAILFVYTYMAFMTRSLWLTTLGLGQVIMCFASSYMLYFMFGNRYVGVFQILSAYILTGIAVDDVFVFLDAWTQSLATDSEIAGDMLNRISWTWRRAAKAMFVTSCTTTVSFGANAASSFPAISTFGIFSALLVVTNYLSVIFFFPTVVTFMERYLMSVPFCCGICDRICGRSSNPAKELRDVNETTTSHAKEIDVDELRAMERFFHRHYSKAIITASKPVVLCFLAFGIVTLVFASRLETDEEPPQFFPPGNPYAEFLPAKASNFGRGPDVYSLEVQVLFGFDTAQPIDRRGTEPTNATDYGKPVFDDNFSIAVGSNCVVSLCQKLRDPIERLKVGGEPAYPVECWVEDFKEFVLGLPNGQATWDAATGPDADTDLYLSTFLLWFTSDPSLYTQWKPYLWAEGTDVEEPALRFTYLSMQINESRLADFEEGIKLFRSWESWLVQELQSEDGNCTDVQDALPALVSSEQPGFDYYFVQETLQAEAFSGIALSLILAWAILVATTGNLVVGFLAALNIAGVVMAVIACVVWRGWKLGVIESICLVMVPGLSVDATAHLAEAYLSSHHTKRDERVVTMLTEVGVSVVSGGVSTLGSAMFLFAPTIYFFYKFGIFLFWTISLSLTYAIVLFPALLAWAGPQGRGGDLRMLWESMHLANAWRM